MGFGRTNYVRISDRAALDALAQLCTDAFEALTRTQDDRVAFSVYDVTDDGTIPNWLDDSEGVEHEDVLAEIALMMDDGEVLIQQSCGSDKARSLWGASEAYDNSGGYILLRLDDIYGIAAKHFDVPRESIGTATY
jgi:hypothetical protein